MVLIVRFFAVLVILYGSLLILRPEFLKKIFDRMRDKNNFYIASAAKAAAGIILIVAAAECLVPWIIRFFGALSLFGGVLAFVVKKRLITGLFDWMEKQPSRFTYYVGAIAVLLGTIMVMAA